MSRHNVFRFNQQPERAVRKPKVLACVLTGVERTNWINPDLLMTFLQMSKDSRFDVSFCPVTDCRPWEAARNYSIHAARQFGMDWLISFDNDNFVHGNPLDVLVEAGADKHVIGLTSGIGGSVNAGYHLYPNQDHFKPETCGNFREVTEVGGGVLIIRKTVWERIPRGPWFRFLYQPDSELHLPTPQEAIPEDKFFCQLARQNGFKVWNHTQRMAGHYRTTDITGMICTMAQMQNAAR